MDVLAREVQSSTPLEDFFRDYLNAVGGDWDEIEPQVYDVLLPPEEGRSLLESASGVLRLTFDPEALPEHPGAQLASFGTPFMDALLADAVRRGRSARFFLVGLNVSPHDLGGKVRRAVKVGDNAELHVERARPLYFAQGVFWFQAQFASDQKEQQIVAVAMDLHYARQVRHFDQLLDPARLAEQPALLFPEARRSSLAAVYPQAREEVVRTVAALANVRGRELADRCNRQIARMTRYYADLRRELNDEAQRRKHDADGEARLAGRRAAIDREEQVRVAELRQRSMLRVHLRLLQVATIQQPKLQVQALVRTKGLPPLPLHLVWDPLTESVEAPPCAACGRPSYALQASRRKMLICPACVGSSPRSA